MGGQPRVTEKVGDRWEVSVAASDDGFQQFSFVNSIATTKGGTHISHVADQVVEKVLEHLKKKHKGMEKTVRPACLSIRRGPLLSHRSHSTLFHRSSRRTSSRT